MRNNGQIGATRSHGQSLLPWPPPERWNRPTFGEFLERVEHEFGAAADLAGLMLLGLGRDEQLGPNDIEALCGQLGVPAEDFGVGP
jgi:hypothetical protein